MRTSFRQFARRVLLASRVSGAGVTIPFQQCGLVAGETHAPHAWECSEDLYDWAWCYGRKR